MKFGLAKSDSGSVGHLRRWSPRVTDIDTNKLVILKDNYVQSLTELDIEVSPGQRTFAPIPSRWFRLSVHIWGSIAMQSPVVVHR